MKTASLLIPVFEVHFNIDLSGIPKVVFTNQSSGTLTGCKFYFDVISPEGFPLISGSIDNPDAVDYWTKFEHVLPSASSFTFGAYTLKASVKAPDSTATSVITRQINVQRPAGNQIGGNDNYGAGKLYYELQCNNGVILAEDRTPLLYKGKEGVVLSRKITFAPPDLDEQPIAPVVLRGYKVVKFEIPFAAAGFYLFLDTVAHFADDVNNTSVTLKYVRKHCFPIYCNVDFCKLSCEVTKFEERVAAHPTPENVAKLTIINSKLSRALIAQQNPSCGVDVTKVISEIAAIAGFGSCFTCYTDGKGNANGSSFATPLTTSIPCASVQQVVLGNAIGRTASSPIILPAGTDNWTVPAGTRINALVIIDTVPIRINVVGGNGEQWLTDVDCTPPYADVDWSRYFPVDESISFPGVAPSTVIKIYIQ